MRASSLPSLVLAGDEQYDTGQDEDDSAPERRTHSAPRNDPVSRPQLTYSRTGRPHCRLDSDIHQTRPLTLLTRERATTAA